MNDGGGWATIRERSARVESPGKCVTERSFTLPFLLDTVFIRTALPCSGGYHLESGGMPLHDEVGINCKKGATTEIKSQESSIRAKGCILMIVCVCVCII